MMTNLRKIVYGAFCKKRRPISFVLGVILLLFSARPCFSGLGVDFSLSEGLGITYSVAEYDPEAYLEACNIDEYNKKYSEEGSCWSCDIIHVLMKSMTSAAKSLGALVASLGMQILLVGAAVWLAIYFLKSLASPAQQDPAKILDGAFTFMFKVALVYILISGGVEGLAGQVVNPLLSIGMDIGTTFNHS